MALEIAVPRASAELTSDERWAAWIARGHEHDRTSRTRARIVFTVIASAAALWLSILLLQ